LVAGVTRGSLLWLAYGAVLVGGWYTVGPGRSGEDSHPASAATIPAGTPFSCTPTGVYDGDGPIYCAEGVTVRLAGIAAREMNGRCRSNQPCPAASATAARDHLRALVEQSPRLACISAGDGRYGRTAAWCGSQSAGDLSCRMVESGLALRWARYWGEHRC
jgi:endonuclease YncB( thermonuclease family)